MFGHDGKPSSVHAHVHCLRSEQCTCAYDLNTLSHCWTVMHEMSRSWIGQLNSYLRVKGQGETSSADGLKVKALT